MCGRSVSATEDLTWSYPKLQGLHYIAKGSSYLKRMVVWSNQSEPTVTSRQHTSETSSKMGLSVSPAVTRG